MELRNVMMMPPRTADRHWDVYARTIFEDDRLSVRHNYILANGGAQEHRHDFDSHHIFFVLRGALNVKCGGEEKTVRQGYAFWFEPGEAHQVCADGEQDAEYLTINCPSFAVFQK